MGHPGARPGEDTAADRLLLNFLQNRPGADARELARALDLRMENLQGHLKSLIARGKVKSYTNVEMGRVEYYLLSQSPKIERPLANASGPDNYSVLGLSPGASRADVKHAFRKLSMKWHPDRHMHLDDKRLTEEANEKYLEVSQAYEAIKRERGW
jgi:DnaJ-domain-containing protein 1